MPTITQVPVVNLLEALRELQKEEWAKFNEEAPSLGSSKDLPDGREDIRDRLWDEISEHYHGNQKFTNDSLFIYVFPSINGEPLTEDMEKLYDLCKDAIVDDRLVFEVSW